MANKRLDDNKENVEADIDIVGNILKTLYGGPRKNLAERLIKRFGSIGRIFRATQDDLIKVDGMTEAAAAFFCAAGPEIRQALRRAAKDIKPSSEYELVYLAIAMDSENTEKYRLIIYADGNDKIIKYEKMTNESVKKVIGTACGVNASSVAVIEYGRREKKRSPDVTALKFTAELVKALSAVGIRFIDYIDYIGHKFFTLRRAIDGQTQYTELSGARKEKYEKVPNFCERIEEYSKKREISAREGSAALRLK